MSAPIGVFDALGIVTKTLQMFIDRADNVRYRRMSRSVVELMFGFAGRTTSCLQPKIDRFDDNLISK